MKRNRPVSLALALVLVGALVLVFAVTGGSAKKTQRTVAGGSAVSVKQTVLGRTLVDANGRTLYLFQADRPDVSTLSQAGLAVWPAFTSGGTPQATGGATAADLGTIAGPGGARQVTYHGHPLYYYVGDRQGGSTSGQGLNQFGGLWYVLSPSGSAITSAPPAAAPAAEGATGEGAGYRSGY
jgi:predicted lipoprotein with Yx(FWY)xxD motif